MRKQGSSDRLVVVRGAERTESEQPKQTSTKSENKTGCFGCFGRKSNKTTPLLVLVGSNDRMNGSKLRRGASRQMTVEDLRAMSVRATKELELVKAALAEHGDPDAETPNSRKRRLDKEGAIPLKDVNLAQMINIFLNMSLDEYCFLLQECAANGNMFDGITDEALSDMGIKLKLHRMSIIKGFSRFSSNGVPRDEIVNPMVRKMDRHLLAGDPLARMPTDFETERAWFEYSFKRMDFSALSDGNKGMNAETQQNVAEYITSRTHLFSSDFNHELFVFEPSPVALASPVVQASPSQKTTSQKNSNGGDCFITLQITVLNMDLGKGRRQKGAKDANSFSCEMAIVNEAMTQKDWSGNHATKRLRFEQLIDNTQAKGGRTLNGASGVGEEQKEETMFSFEDDEHEAVVRLRHASWPAPKERKDKGVADGLDEEENEWVQAIVTQLRKGATVYCQRGRDEWDVATVIGPAPKKKDHWIVKFKGEFGKGVWKKLSQIKVQGVSGDSSDAVDRAHCPSLILNVHHRLAKKEEGALDSAEEIDQQWEDSGNADRVFAISYHVQDGKRGKGLTAYRQLPVWELDHHGYRSLCYKRAVDDTRPQFLCTRRARGIDAPTHFNITILEVGQVLLRIDAMWKPPPVQGSYVRLRGKANKVRMFDFNNGHMVESKWIPSVLEVQKSLQDGWEVVSDSFVDMEARMSEQLQNMSEGKSQNRNMQLMTR
jgi:hypothetical protein